MADEAADQLDSRHEYVLGIRDLDQFTGEMDRWTGMLDKQAGGEEAFEENFATAVEIAANLRAADARYKNLGEGAGEKFLEAYKRYAVAHMDFDFDIVTSLLGVIYDQEEERGWELEEMSDWLQEHCIEVLKKTLEDKRAKKTEDKEEYERVLFEIGGFYRRANPGENLHEQLLKSDFLKKLVDALEQMLTDKEKETFADPFRP